MIVLPEDEAYANAAPTERSPLKAAAASSPVNGPPAYAAPPPPYGAISHTRTPPYPGPSWRPPHGTLPPVAPIVGLPTPQSYSPSSPSASPHAGPWASAGLHGAPQNASRRARNRFIKAWLLAATCVLVWLLIFGSAEVAFHDHPRHPGQFIRAWVVDTVFPGSYGDLRIPRRQRGLPECVMVPQPPGPPPGSDRNPHMPVQLPPLKGLPPVVENPAKAPPSDKPVHYVSSLEFLD